MKENVSGDSRNPCSLNRERDATFAAKLLTLPTGFFSAEKSEEWMARSPVWPDDVIASETASRHQPMNWRDSIWAQTRSRGRRSRCVKLATQPLVPYSENKGYASNPRRFLLFQRSYNRKITKTHNDTDQTNIYSKQKDTIDRSCPCFCHTITFYYVRKNIA